MSSNTIIVLGSITRDRIRTQRSFVEQIGGAVWYAGVTFAKLGLKVRAVTGFASSDHVIGDAFRGVDHDHPHRQLDIALDLERPYLGG